jgi:hypothetical protein
MYIWIYTFVFILREVLGHGKLFKHEFGKRIREIGERERKIN